MDQELLMIAELAGATIKTMRENGESGTRHEIEKLIQAVPRFRAARDKLMVAILGED